MSCELLVGDCVKSMKSLPDQSVNCCVTSPPYFGLRDYGMVGQIGLEETPDEFVARLVEVFREVKRVLRDDGTLWLNIGDSYCGYKGDNYGRTKGNLTARTPVANGARLNVGTPQTSGVKNKDLIGIPWVLAFALRADGWYLRQEIIWHKPNPMPESVRDRCTKAHEYIFLLSKSPRYHFDSEAMKEPAVGCQTGKAVAHNGEMRNRRSVWSVPTKPYKGAHFATFPPALIEPCVLAGCPVGGTVLDPFGGSGTTAGVALAHNRNAIICELNPDYAKLVEDRILEIVRGIL